MKMYRLSDNQIQGRYFGNNMIFDSKEEVKETLIVLLENDGEENYNDLPLRELLEMADYEIEEVI